MINVCLLGSGGSLPSYERALTSLMVEISGKKILIDCGEGTQMSMKRQGTGFKDVDVICFTHYHADHIVSLPGILLSMANSGRVEPITIVGPKGLTKVIEGLTVITPGLPFELKLKEVPISKEIITLDINEFENTYIQCAYMEHSALCLGYSINVTRQGLFNAAKAKELNIPMKYWKVLQKGESVDGYTPDMVLGEPRRGIKLTYSTDTRPTKNLVKLAQESDLFICEGMYGDPADMDKALKNKHMMFHEAAEMAARAKAKEMWLTHFSPSVVKPEIFLSNATEIFQNTVIGKDRKVTELNYED